MFYWIIKIFALLTCIALLLGLAAETTTLMGDAASQNPRLEKTNKPVGIMLVKRQNNRNRPPKCEAYAWNTDFPQRSGAIFHGAFYHSLTILGFLAMLVHQGLRGIAPNTLPALFKFVPSLQGQWGLWASGAIMVYVGLLMMSYSIGELHLITAGILILAGAMNFCGGFFQAIASADALPPVGALPDMGGDPYGDDMYGAPPPMDPMAGMPGGAGGPGGGGPAPPDPYGDGAKGNGVGAGAAPPGMFTKGTRTSGGIPSRYGAKFNEDDDSDDDDDERMVVDSRTGLWTKAKHLKQLPANGFMPGMLPMPMGYDIYGRLVMAPSPYTEYMPGASIDDRNSKRSSRSLKKAIKRQARKELEKMRSLDEEDEEDVSDVDDRDSTRSARCRRREERKRLREDVWKQQQYERQIREEEKRQQMIAKGIAIADARQKAAQEVAQEDARMQNYQEMLDNQRHMAMTDAQRRQFQEEMNEMREQQLLVLAKRKAELDAQERARLDQEMYQRQIYQARQQQQQIPRYPPPAAVPMRASAISGSRSLPPYTPYGAQYAHMGQPLRLPGQRSQPPSYRGSNRALAPSFGHPTSAGQQQYGVVHPHQMARYTGDAEDSELDFDDDITEIQSVRSETSSQRRLVARRMQEERDRVLDAQERERSLNRRASYSEDDIIEGYRSSTVEALESRA